MDRLVLVEKNTAHQLWRSPMSTIFKPFSHLPTLYYAHTLPGNIIKHQAKPLPLRTAPSGQSEIL